MEYVEGGTLRELIETGAVSLGRRLQWMEDSATACLRPHGRRGPPRHQAGERDDSEPDGVLKILDFGIARSSMIGGAVTRDVVGTLNYMAPEQWTGTGSVDLRADMFAAGAVSTSCCRDRRFRALTSRTSTAKSSRARPSRSSDGSPASIRS